MNDDIWGGSPLENFLTDDEIMEIERRNDDEYISKNAKM
jgi:hypothetical protein